MMIKKGAVQSWFIQWHIFALSENENIVHFSQCFCLSLVTLSWFSILHRIDLF